MCLNTCAKQTLIFLGSLSHCEWKASHRAQRSRKKKGPKMECVGWTTLKAKEGILTVKYDSRNMWPKFIGVMIINLESRPLIKTSPKISPFSAQVSSIMSYFVCLIGLVVALHASQGSQDHPDLQKNIFIHLTKKILYAKLTCCDYPNKYFEHPNLRITKIWVQQK